MATVSAVDSHNHATSSAPRVHGSSRVRIGIFAFLALLAGTGAAVALDKWKFEEFDGYLQARWRTVTAGREARISRILVSSGQVVTAGQPLVELIDDTLEQRLAAKHHEIAALEAELNRTQAALEVELEWRRKDLIEQIFQTRWKSAQSVRRQMTVPTQPAAMNPIVQTEIGAPPFALPLDRSSILFDERHPIELINAERAGAAPLLAPHAVAIGEQELCTEHVRELERIVRELPDKISRSMGLNLVQARLDHAKAEMAVLDTEKERLTLTAPVSGLVGVFHKGAGDHTTPHEPLVQLLDEEQPYLLLQFPSERIADFSPGTVLDLQFPSGHRGKGRVEQIPPQASGLPGDTSGNPEMVIGAHVERTGALWPSLPFGSKVEVLRRR